MYKKNYLKIDLHNLKKELNGVIYEKKYFKYASTISTIFSIFI